MLQGSTVTHACMPCMRAAHAAMHVVAVLCPQPPACRKQRSSGAAQRAAAALNAAAVARRDMCGSHLRCTYCTMCTLCVRHLRAPFHSCNSHIWLLCTTGVGWCKGAGAGGIIFLTQRSVVQYVVSVLNDSTSLHSAPQATRPGPLLSALIHTLARFKLVVFTLPCSCCSWTTQLPWWPPTHSCPHSPSACQESWCWSLVPGWAWCLWWLMPWGQRCGCVRHSGTLA